MEVHIERLKHLCRICGQKIVVKRGYISYQGSLNPKTCEEYSLYVVVLRHYYGILHTRRRIKRYVFAREFSPLPNPHH